MKKTGVNISVNAKHEFGKMAQLLECPYKREDLIIPKLLKNTLNDFISEALNRNSSLEKDNTDKLISQGRGLIAIFSGESGTGKTMAAQVIAAELGLDLYRIDLSSVVSKYVGETSQNLERIFSGIENMDVVLLFDEADALFGKRTEVRNAHDRFANTDTNYLLQSIENYQGIVLLSTNKKENIDTAFIRHLRYVLEFPKPDAKERKRIWNRIIGVLESEKQISNLKKHINNLANHVELTGAQIKYSILSAKSIAKKEKKKLTLTHLMHGINLEIGKEGRTLSEHERKRLIE